MSLIRTFTVTVVSTGGGNKYFLDGVQQPTISLAEGYTYKFDQSDSSNGTGGTHPLRFSTNNNNSPSAPYTTGVTTSGTPGQAGAYVQIEVAVGAPTLYYYCTNHSGMGGQANTVDPDTWGVLPWNQNAWGSQDQVNVTLTGLSATSSLGAPTAFNATGWGADGWGAEGWGGEVSLIPLTGLSLTATVNLPTNSVSVTPGWGTETWGQNGWGNVEAATEPLPAQSLTSTVGAITPADQIMGLTGLSMTSTIGSPSIVVDCTLTLPSQSLTATLGGVGGVIVEILPGQSLTTTFGGVTTSMIVPVSLTGLSMTSTIGSPVITSNPGVQPTGVSATSTVGSVDITIGELLPAQSLTSTVGSLTVATATIITMPGFELPITLNLPSSTAYKDIVIDGNTSYTDVDITGNTSYTDVKHVNQA